MIRQAIVVALKFILPVFYPRYPFAAGWANLVLDSIDGDILVPAGMAEHTYQLLDKAADYWAYIWMLVWGWRTPVRKEITAAFLLRTIGQLLFFATGNELALFFFPNLLEPLFLTYATLLRVLGPEQAATTYRRHLVLIWVLLLVYKFQDEWLTHVANVDRSTWVKGLLNR